MTVSDLKKMRAGKHLASRCSVAFINPASLIGVQARRRTIKSPRHQAIRCILTMILSYIYLLYLLSLVQSISGMANAPLRTIPRNIGLLCPSCIAEALKMDPVLDKDDPFIRIGGLFSLSSSLFLANAYGIYRFEAFRYIVNEINKGVYGNVGNKTLVYSAFDTGTLSYIAQSEAISVILMNNVTMVVGPNYSDETIVAGAILDKYSIGCVSYAATSPLISNKVYPNFVRIAPNDEIQNEALLSVLLDLDLSLLVAIFTNDTYGKAGQLFFTKAQAEHKIKLDCITTVSQLHTDKDIQDSHEALKAFAHCAKDSKAKAALIYCDGLSTQPIFSALSKHKSTVDLLYVVSSWMASFYVSETFPDIQYPTSILNESLGVIPYRGEYPGFKSYIWSLNPANTEYSYFHHYWETQFKCLYPDIDHPNHAVALDKETGKLVVLFFSILEDSMKKKYEIVNVTLTRENIYELFPVCDENADNRAYPLQCVCTKKETLRDIPIDVRVGSVMDSVTAIWIAIQKILGDCHLASIDAGYDLCSKKKINGMDIVRVMEKTQFDGITGPVKLHHGERVSPMFEIVQVVQDGYLNTVGTWNNGVISLNKSLLFWKNATGFPKSKVTPEFCGVNQAFGAIWAAITIIFFATAVLAGILILRNQHHPRVKSLSPLFLLFIIMGICCSLVGVFLFLIYPTQVNCILKLIFLFIGFGLIFGSLAAKSYRIYKIFIVIRIRTTRYSNAELCMFIVFVLLGEITLLLLLFLLAGKPIPRIAYDTNDQLYSFIFCSSPDPNSALALFISLILYNLLVIGTSAVLAFRTRKVRSEFNESGSIALVAYSCLLVITITVPLYFAMTPTKNHACYQNAILYISGTLIPVCSLLFLFAPICKMILYNKKRNSARKFTNLASSDTDWRPPEANTFHDETSARHLSRYLNTYENLRPSRPFVTQGLWDNQKIVFSRSDWSAFQSSGKSENSSASTFTGMSITAEETSKDGDKSPI